MYLFLHNKNWKSEYEFEERLLLTAYGNGLCLHHIGSTAIKGLDAKDCIDILGVVSDLSSVRDRVPSILKLGYEYRSAYGIQGREYFSKSQRKVHLHIFREGDLNIGRHLHFVHVMKNSETLVNQLNNLKQELQSKYPNSRTDYQREKAGFYDEIHKML